MQLSPPEDPQALDALAAAQAENGQYAEAVRSARKALEAATRQHDQRLAEAIRGRIALYGAGRPFQEPAGL
jgi:Flp pilus assembly protein TadD